MSTLGILTYSRYSICTYYIYICVCTVGIEAILFTMGDLTLLLHTPWPWVSGSTVGCKAPTRSCDTSTSQKMPLRSPKSVPDVRFHIDFTLSKALERCDLV